MNATTAPGWYPDPWQQAAWRWHDGFQWTAHVQGPAGAATADRKPILPAFLSWPVVLAFLPALGFALLSSAQAPVALAAAFIPLIFVLPVLWWVDRLEPEPRSARIHAALWGGTVAAMGALICNSIVAVAAGETAAAVVSAPLSEEILKGLAIVMAVRRHQLDGVADGIVYAGWAALGFAVIENVSYFGFAASEGLLVETIVGRAFLTPFAHPLFTAWTGLAIGLAVRRGRSLGASWWGWVAAIVSHAAWNGTLSLAQFVDEMTASLLILAMMGVFFLLFVAAGLMLRWVRNDEKRHLQATVPQLAARYGLSAQELTIFADWRLTLETRRRVKGENRRRFDAVHAALIRLAELWRRPDRLGGAEEQRLAEQLRTARSAWINPV